MKEDLHLNDCDVKDLIRKLDIVILDVVDTMENDLLNDHRQ
jgi:hypothetical protein